PRPVSLAQVSTVLQETFGCHGSDSLYDRLTILRKTSPSGGALHPVEAYPLVLRAEGVETGLYHYGVERHSLELLRELDEAGAADLAAAFTAGQGYFASAAVLVALTVRFERSFWKYPRHDRAYAVTLLDAGHLGQTF